MDCMEWDQFPNQLRGCVDLGLSDIKIKCACSLTLLHWSYLSLFSKHPWPLCLCWRLFRPFPDVTFHDGSFVCPCPRAFTHPDEVETAWEDTGNKRSVLSAPTQNIKRPVHPDPMSPCLSAGNKSVWIKEPLSPSLLTAWAGAKLTKLTGRTCWFEFREVPIKYCGKNVATQNRKWMDVLSFSSSSRICVKICA